MHSFRFRSAEPVLSARAIGLLRNVTALGIAELKRRAAEREPLLEFAIFDNQWQESKPILKRLAAGIESGELPLEIYEVTQLPGYALEEERLSPNAFRERLQTLRGIELEQDMAAQLETGYIQFPEEYEPPLDDD